MLSPDSSSGVKKTANRLLVLLLAVGAVIAECHPAVKAQGRRRAPAGAARAGADRPTSCEQSKADAEGRVKELRERVDKHLKEIGLLQSRFAARGLSYDDWVRLSDAEKKKAITEAERAAADLVLDYLKTGLIAAGDLGPIDAADFIKKHGVTDPALVSFLQRFALNNVYKYPTWAQTVEKAIDYLKAQHDLEELGAGRERGEAGSWDGYVEVIVDVLPYQIERYAFSRPPFKQEPVLKAAEALKTISMGWTLSRTISASGASIYATYVSLRNISTLTDLNHQDLAALAKLDSVLKADVERLKQARLDLNRPGDCPDEAEIVFTYSASGGAAVPAVPGLNPDFVAALRDQERLLNAAQATDDPTLKQFLLTAAAATDKNNVRVSTDPAYYASLAAKARELDQKIDEIQAQIDALSAQGKVAAAMALEKEQEALVLEKNKVIEKATPQPSGPPSYTTILGDERAGNPAPAGKGLSRVVVVNNTGKSIAVGFGSGSFRLAVGASFTRQVPAGRYALNATTSAPVGGRILRGQSSLAVEAGSDYEVSVALAKKETEAGEDVTQGATPQLRARVVGAQPREGPAPDRADPNRGGAGPLYYTYDGGKLIPEGAAAPGEARPPRSAEEPSGPPPGLLRPGREGDLSEWLAEHPQFLNRVLSNNLPPELKSRPIELSDQEATDRSKIPPGWVECSCPNDHPGLGIFIREGGRIRQFHDPNFQCP